MIDVVIATISSRRESYNRAVISYYENTFNDVNVVTLLDIPSPGEAWNLGASSITERGEYLHFTGDDLEVLPNWDIAAIEAVKRGVYPAPRFLDANGNRMHYDDGAPASWVPFMSWDMWDLIGPTLNQHYGCDDWLDRVANRLGFPTEVVDGYRIIDHGLPTSYDDRWEKQAREQRQLEEAWREFVRKHP